MNIPKDIPPQYTASLYAVIFTFQQNHYPHLNRVAEYSIVNISTNNPSRVTLLQEFTVTWRKVQ